LIASNEQLGAIMAYGDDRPVAMVPSGLRSDLLPPTTLRQPAAQAQGMPEGIVVSIHGDNDNGTTITSPSTLTAASCRISGELLRGIQFDEQSRTEWLETRAKGIRILGLKIEDPARSDRRTASLEGMSNVKPPDAA
jgi:hypothetical protein